MLIQTIFPGYCCSFFSNLLEKIWITGEEIPSWSLLGVRTLLRGSSHFARHLGAIMNFQWFVTAMK